MLAKSALTVVATVRCSHVLSLYSASSQSQFKSSYSCYPQFFLFQYLRLEMSLYSMWCWLVVRSSSFSFSPQFASTAPSEYAPRCPALPLRRKKFYATRSVSHWSYTPRAYGKRKHHLRLRRECDATARARVVHSEMQVRAARVARHGVTRALSLGSHPRTTDLA